MAVPGDNGLVDEDAAGDFLLMEDVDDMILEFESDVPPDFRDLADAAVSGDLDALRAALDNLTGSIDEAVEDGDAALHLTCLYGHLPCVQLLLERGASLEARDEDGAIPLHDACAGGVLEIVELLINSANDPECVKRMIDTADVEGDTPLHHAARGEHEKVVSLLLSHGASPLKTNTSGKTPGELADPGTEARIILEAAASRAVPSQ